MWQSNAPYSAAISSINIVAIALAGSGTVSGSSSGSSSSSSSSTNTSQPDLSWYRPNATGINNLGAVINGTGVFGFQFHPEAEPRTYNWCNMPHVHTATYPSVPDGQGYKLEYVEVIHRHHKRTPYAANTFPHENYAWYCDDAVLAYGGIPIPDSNFLNVGWKVYTSSVSPLAVSVVGGGFNGTCQFPQITAGGLNDSRQHGKDLFSLYHDKLGFLPAKYDSSKVSYRVTNNVITSQVASQVIYGMYPDAVSSSSSSNNNNNNINGSGFIDVLIQPDAIDSLEPAYTCTDASDLCSSYGVGSTVANWTAHLTDSAALFDKLDSVSGLESNNTAWHQSFDHYFDNLSARLCHNKPLPCKDANATATNNTCITQTDANAVFRAGEYEYSFIYRDSPASLAASTASFGIWVAELTANLKAAATQSSKVIYRHNVAHDGSLARLLSILQVDVMVWPGMGSEIVFELYSRSSSSKEWFIRVLFSGQILRSSNPSLGLLNLIPLSTLTDYFDGLVGVNAVNVPGLCGTSTT